MAKGTKAKGAGGTPAIEKVANKKLVEQTLGLLARDDEARATGEREIGEHVLDAYFGGDHEAALSKSPRKPLSYAALAERAAAETMWTEERLRRAVKVAIAWRSLAAKVREGLSGRDLFRLASIDDIRVRRGVAAQLASGELMGRAADQAIAAAGASERRGGRAPTPPAEKLLSAVERALEGVAARSVAKGIADEAREALAERLRDAAERLRKLADRLA
jgi:hypothetical protein